MTDTAEPGAMDAMTDPTTLAATPETLTDPPADASGDGADTGDDTIASADQADESHPSLLGRIEHAIEHELDALRHHDGDSTAADDADASGTDAGDASMDAADSSDASIDAPAADVDPMPDDGATATPRAD